MKKNVLTRKIRLISKFVKSESGIQTIVTHTLSNISRSKGNQALKIGQLKEYKMKNIFLQKLYTNVGEKLFLDPFLKNQNCTHF